MSPLAPGLGQPEFENFARAAVRRSPEPGDFVAGEGSGSQAAPAGFSLAVPGSLVPGKETFCVDYFLNYEERLGSSFKQHSQALKCRRRVAEDRKEPFESNAKWFDNAEPTMVIVREHSKGASSIVNRDEQVPWRRQEMVATLRGGDIMEVALGPRSSGAPTRPP